APLAGDHRVLGQVPPEVVGQILVATVGLPGAFDVERVVVNDEHAARTVAVRRAERARVDAVWSAVDGVRTAIAGLARQLVGLDHLDQPWLAWIRLRVQHVDARGAQSGHEQVAPLDVRVWGVRAEGRAAGVPAEVVQLVADVRHGRAPDDLTVARGAL